jgi:nucleotide-binding universal stress UspA family protein
MEIRNILVPVDFSPTAQYAVDLAVSLARRFRARLTLLHVVEDASALSYSFPGKGGEAANQRSADAFERLSAMLSPEDQDDLDLQILIRSGNIEAELLAAIPANLESIVVMGTHHHGLIQRVLIGSVTQDMLRKLPVPVLTVSCDSKRKTLSRVLFATDLTESSQEGFKFALDLVRTLGAHLMVVHAIEPVPLSLGGGMPLFDTLAERQILHKVARRKLEELEQECARQQVMVTSQISEGIAAEKILEASENCDSELIVLTIQHKGLIERGLLGSTAERVVRDSRVPVLSFPVHSKTERASIAELHRTSSAGPSATS